MLLDFVEEQMESLVVIMIRLVSLLGGESMLWIRVCFKIMGTGFPILSSNPKDPSKGMPADKSSSAARE